MNHPEPDLQEMPPWLDDGPIEPVVMRDGVLIPRGDEITCEWPGGPRDSFDAAATLFGARNAQAHMGIMRWSERHLSWMRLGKHNVWERVSDEVVRSQVAKLLLRCKVERIGADGKPQEVAVTKGRRFVLDIVDAAKDVLYSTAEEWPVPEGVPFSDGMLVLRDGSKRGILAADGVTSVLTQPSPTTDATPMLDEWARNMWAEKGPEVTRTLMQWLGATLLWEATKHHKAIVMYGIAGCGKSTFLKVVAGLFPTKSAAISHVQPGDTGEFAATGLVASQINLCDELTKTGPWDAGYYKSAVTGSQIEVNRKHKDAVSVRPRAGWIIATNTMPDIRHESVEQRTILIHCAGKQWRGTEGEVKDIDKAILDSEAGAIVLRAIRTYAETGTIDRVEVDPELRDEAKRHDPVVSFLADVLVPDPGNMVDRGAAYQAYRRHCQTNGHIGILSSSKFRGALREAGVKQLEKYNGKPRVLDRKLIEEEREDNEYRGPSW